MEERGVASNSIVRENLPFPIVHYPDRFCVFIGFAEYQHSEPSLCLCSKRAIENLVRLKEVVPKKPIFHLDDLYFGSGRIELRAVPGKFTLNGPQKSIKNLEIQFFPGSLQRTLGRGRGLLQSLRFAPNLCHRCNQDVPSMDYMEREFRSQFRKRFGWYVNLEYLTLGIFPHGLGIVTAFTFFTFLPGVSRPEFDQLEVTQLAAQNAYIAKHQELLNGDPVVRRSLIYEEYSRIRSDTNQSAQEIDKKIENLVRQGFGVKRIGDAHVNETLLYQLVRNILVGKKVVRHHRSSWLEGLELDIFVPELSLAIEYQGMQHFKPIEAWGGEAALRSLQERDARKVNLCQEHGVRLVHVNYNEPLTEHHIRSKLSSILHLP